MTTPARIFCPSAPMKVGSVLLGIVMPDGRVAFAPRQLTVNHEFAAAAEEGDSPEKRFRFASSCVQTGCRQWSNGRCGVIDTVMQSAPRAPSPDLPPCVIRGDCRWFLQSGPEACRVCPYVVTDCRDDAA